MHLTGDLRCGVTSDLKRDFCVANHQVAVRLVWFAWAGLVIESDGVVTRGVDASWVIR